MTDEYIRKQDAVMQLSHNKSRGDDEWELAVASDMEIIRKLPPADVAPVVRCKDCEHDISSQFDTEARCNLWGCLKPKRGFCDAGKRREE